MSEFRVTMLGTFSLEKDGRRIDDSANRMRKVWLLLAYLIFSRSSAASQEALASLLSGDSDDAADPGGRIKATFYRVRTMLDQLGENVGHSCVLHKGGVYTWNSEIPLRLDAEEFEILCRRADAEPDRAAALDLYRQALALYQGDFLPKLAAEPWVMPIHTYYHQMFLAAAEDTLSILQENSFWDEAAALCRRALKIEPYSETLWQHLMRALIATDDRSGALRAYEEMSELLFSTFGVMPSDESRQLYRTAAREAEPAALPAGSVREMLQEPAGANGAMVCEYDFFRLLYQVQARTLLRSGDVIHIALLSLHPRGGGEKALTRRSLDIAAENLQDLLVRTLRRGDVVTKCSVSQFIVMLPQANYENSRMVCDRIERSFCRQFPHSPVQIHFSVQPLEPLALK